MPNIPKGIKYI